MRRARGHTWRPMLSLVVEMFFSAISVAFFQRIVKFYMFCLVFWLSVLFDQVRATKQRKERLKYGDDFVDMTVVLPKISLQFMA